MILNLLKLKKKIQTNKKENSNEKPVHQPLLQRKEHPII